MSTLYTSSLITPSANPVELLIPVIATIDQTIQTVVSLFSAQGQSLGDINPSSVYVENCVVGNTRVRVNLKDGQVTAGQQVQIKVNQIS